MVEPVHPFESGEFHRIDISPWPAPPDHLGLEQADNGFGEGIIVGVADAADRWLNACCGQSLSVADRDVLAATVAMMHQALSMKGTTLVERLFESIEDES